SCVDTRLGSRLSQSIVSLTATSPCTLQPLSLRGALPISLKRPRKFRWHTDPPLEQLLISDGEKIWLYDPDLEQEISSCSSGGSRSEEHTSELQSRENLVCRLLLEKKKE